MYATCDLITMSRSRIIYTVVEKVVRGVEIAVAQSMQYLEVQNIGLALDPKESSMCNYILTWSYHALRSRHKRILVVNEQT